MPSAQKQVVTANGTYTFQRESDAAAPPNVTLQSTLIGSGAVSATVQWNQSLDNLGFPALQTQSPSGTNLGTAINTVVSSASIIQAVVTALSASTTLTLSIGE